MLQPRISNTPPVSSSHEGVATNTGEDGGDDDLDWDALAYISPRTTFASTEDEEPWYWGILDEDPVDFCPPCGTEMPSNHGEQEQEAHTIFTHEENGTPTWVPGDIDIPAGYIALSCRKGWSDSYLGPVLRLEPSHQASVMGADGEEDSTSGVAPPTPISGHTPPATPLREEKGTLHGLEEGMTLTQAHSWWEHDGGLPTTRYRRSSHQTYMGKPTRLR